MKGYLFVLIFVLLLGESEQVASPTVVQLNWHKQEIGVLIHFNMATFIKNDGCSPQEVPDISLWNPYLLNTEQWVHVIKSLGAKYAVLVAKHNCGFTTWHTNVRFPEDNFVYNYSVQFSKFQEDVVSNFIQSCKKEGIKTGFYYSVVVNSWLNVDNGLVQNGTLAPGQIKISQALYDKIVIAQLTELWTKFGGLDEIWFDGGYTQDLQTDLEKLLALQPQAVAFNGFGISKNPVRWIGTESGHAPDPNWSTGPDTGGDPNSPYWVPPECDTTLQLSDTWFYREGVGLRNMTELLDVYHSTVGHNCVLMMDLTPDRTGLIPASYAARYKELGDFIHSCYDQDEGHTSGSGNQYIINFLTPTTIDRVVIQENQINGQFVRYYKVEVLVDGSTNPVVVSTGTSIGNKKIDIFQKPVIALWARLTIITSIQTPTISNFAAHLCSSK